MERLARQAAQRYDFPAWVLLATAQAEGGMQHGAPYMDTNDQLSFRPYGFQAQSGVTVRGGRWLSEWHAGGDRRKRIQAEVEADLARLEAVTNDAALLMDRYYNRYNGDVDLVRVAWAAGGGAANKARDAGRLPGWYDQRKRDRWHAAVRRWGGSVQTAFA